MASLDVHGISVGPRLILDHGDLCLWLVLAMVVASFHDADRVDLFRMRLFPAVTEVPKMADRAKWVMTCCVVGTFALNNRVTDLYPC